MVKVFFDLLKLILGYGTVLLLLGGAAVIYLFKKYYETEDYRVIAIQEYKELQLKNRALKKTQHILEREQTKLSRELREAQRELELIKE